MKNDDTFVKTSTIDGDLFNSVVGTNVLWALTIPRTINRMDMKHINQTFIFENVKIEA